MENLPLEIADNILSRLPVVLKLKSRVVCKTWRTFVPKPKRGLLYDVLHQNPTKLEAHLYFSEQNTDKVDDDYLGALTKLEHNITLPSPSCNFKSFMVGSCNGLVCYASYDSRGYDRRIYVCNPVTREQTQLPYMFKWDHRAYAEQAIGFGYNRSNNEYKVVRIMLDIYNHLAGTIQVYNLQGGSMWRKTRSSSNVIKYFETPSVGVASIPTMGVSAGGYLHWLGNCNIRPVTVAAFDLEHETLKFLPSIPSIVCDANLELLVLGGNLCVLEVVPSKHVRIWEFRYRKTAKYTETFRWRTKFRIARNDWSWFGLFSREENFLWYNFILSCYDPETETLRKVEEISQKFLEDRSRYATSRATPFMHSLVSWKERKRE